MDTAAIMGYSLPVMNKHTITRFDFANHYNTRDFTLVCYKGASKQESICTFMGKSDAFCVRLSRREAAFLLVRKFKKNHWLARALCLNPEPLIGKKLKLEEQNIAIGEYVKIYSRAFVKVVNGSPRAWRKTVLFLYKNEKVWYTLSHAKWILNTIIVVIFITITLGLWGYSSRILD